MNWQPWLAGLLFIAVYGIIISDKIHRTIIALCGAALLLVTGVLTQKEAIAYLDFNTIGLLAGMMIIVGIARKSGIFEYMAIKAAHLSAGEPVSILVALSIVTAVASAFLDNVTTVLLIVPVTISICNDLEINPVPIFVAEIMASNIGGSSTLIGDPPNIMIGSAAGLGFTDFMYNLAPVIVFIFITTIFLLRYIYKDSFQTREENKARIRAMNPSDAITDKALLIKSSVVMIMVICGFVFHQYLHLDSATVALTGASLLLLIGRVDPEEILNTVEWATLFFFIGLFILVGGLDKVGIIEKMAREAVKLTHGNLTLSTIMILWFSAICSAFIDNIPFVATFIPLIKEVGQVTHMATGPLWWALSLGACLGGNGTLIGASANVVVSGISEREGHPISFLKFMKVAFPLMLLSVFISMVYLLIFFL